MRYALSLPGAAVEGQEYFYLIENAVCFRAAFLLDIYRLMPYKYTTSKMREKKWITDWY